MILKTSRLILRPWTEEDAGYLLKYAADERIGPAAGWPPHKTTDDSLNAIRTVLSAPETYAVVLKDIGHPVGSIGLSFGKSSNIGLPENEAEIGYWIAVPFWGQGLIPEATREIIRHAFEDIGAEKLWCGYFDGNEKSKRVQEKCGFKYRYTLNNVPWPLINAVKTEHITRLTRREWEKSQLNKATRKWLKKYCPERFCGKTVLITGANSGMGFKSAEIMLYLGANVIMACRSSKRAQAAADLLFAKYPGAQITVLLLDLADFSSIDEFVRTVKEQNTDIDVFLNNAGVFHKPGECTKDGFELVIGTNYFGVYYLTENILPYLESLPHPVFYINTVSLIHKIAGIDYSDFYYAKKYKNLGAYARSKLCLAKYTYFKALRLKDTNVKILMSHPGIAITPLGVNAFGKTVGAITEKVRVLFNSPEKSALSLCRILSDNPPAGSITGPDLLFGGWGYPKQNRILSKVKTGGEELITFTKSELKKRNKYIVGDKNERGEKRIYTNS